MWWLFLFIFLVFSHASEYISFPVSNSLSISATADISWKKIYQKGVTLHKGNVFTLKNPLDHFSIHEPAIGCGKGLNTTLETAKNLNCVVATNGGFFNQSVEPNTCFGNVVTNGKWMVKGNKVNVNFGITKKKEFIVGYIDDKELEKMERKREILQLITGAVWLVKNRTNNVKESLKKEDLTVQNAGQSFAKLISARTAIGHNSKGELVLITVDGKSYDHGINLYELADLLIKMDIVNAINLDGGGSTEAIVDNSIVNYPSDPYSKSVYSCERPVTTIICIHNGYTVSPSKLMPLDETNLSLTYVAIFLGILASVSVSFNIVFCLLYYKNKGYLPCCEFLSWAFEKRSDVDDETIMPLDAELIVENSDATPLIAKSDISFVSTSKSRKYDSESDDEIELSSNLFISSPANKKPSDATRDNKKYLDDIDYEFEAIEKQLASASGFK